MRKPKDKTFIDTSGDSIIFKTRNCCKGTTSETIDVLDITMIHGWDRNQIEFESARKVRAMAKKLLEHAKWMGSK